MIAAIPLRKWHEDLGFVTWWKFPVNEPAWIGSPLCSDWPGYHTHFTPHPEIPVPEISNKQKRKRIKRQRSVP